MAATRKIDPKKQKPKDGDLLCWCKHRKADHDGPDGMCKYNTEADIKSCDCGGFEAP